jgi:hypothetical protein
VVVPLYRKCCGDNRLGGAWERRCASCFGRHEGTQALRHEGSGSDEEEDAQVGVRIFGCCVIHFADAAKVRRIG